MTNLCLSMLMDDNSLSGMLNGQISGICGVLLPVWMRNLHFDIEGTLVVSVLHELGQSQFAVASNQQNVCAECAHNGITLERTAASICQLYDGGISEYSYINFPIKAQYWIS